MTTNHSERSLDDGRATSGEGMRIALDAARMAIWNLDLRSNVLAGSPQLNKIMGFPPNAEPTIEEFRSRYAPGEQERLQKLRAEVLARGEPAIEAEFRYLWPDGSSRWLMLRAEAQFDDAGHPARFVGVVMDIDDRKRAELALRESEERFRLVADSAPVMLWMGDQHGKCLYLNEALRRFWGVDLEDVPNFEWTSTLHPEDVELLAEPFEKGMREQSGFFVEARYVRADGEIRVVSTSAQPRLGPHGEFLGMIGVNVDVTEARLAETALQNLNTTLEQRVAEEVAERAKAENVLRQAQKMEAVGQLTGGIAHDFNNMLAVVMSGLDLLERRLANGDTDVARYIEGAREGANRAANLTQRLLAFSRQQPLAPEPIQANRLMSGMTELLKRTLGADISIETVLSAGLWHTHADPGQLENAVLNLAVNARDAMLEGGKLTIETANAHVDERYARQYDIPVGQYVLICVTDTGSGMSPDVMAKAFDPFFTTKDVGKGTGLGLSQVFGFIRQSGGHVKIYSELGHGTTVKMYLPRHYGEVAKAGLEPEGQSWISGDQDEIVLVVEDEEQVRNYAIEALQELGYTVLGAGSGAEALHIIDAGQKITLLFTDVVMPEMSGRQLAEIAVQKRPGLKVLYTTGFTRNAVVHNGVLDPGTNFIAKPFSMDQLAAKVRSVLDGT